MVPQISVQHDTERLQKKERVVREGLAESRGGCPATGAVLLGSASVVAPRAATVLSVAQGGKQRFEESWSYRSRGGSGVQVARAARWAMLLAAARVPARRALRAALRCQHTQHLLHLRPVAHPAWGGGAGQGGVLDGRCVQASHV